MSRGTKRTTIRIYWDVDDYQDVSVDRLAKVLGSTRSDVWQSLEEAVRAGFLTPRRDGAYDATLPVEAP